MPSARYDLYDAFGTTLANAYCFTGESYDDATGSYYLHVRHDDP